MSRRGDIATRARDGAAFELRSGQFSLMVLAIRHLDLLQLQTELGEHVASAPALLQGAPVVLDLNPLSQLADHGLLRELIKRVQQSGLRVIALAANAGAEAAAAALDLPLLGVDRKRMRTLESGPAQVELPLPMEPAAEVEAPEAAEAPEAEAVKPAPPGLQPPLVLPGPIRSGQQVYARGRDLIITGSVSAGAEVAADGCVHVYGRLSGKAMAGAAGDLRARVYCLSFGAEVVSIAGNFKVFESASRDVAGKAVEIFLDEGRLEIRPLRI
ncbi:MAG: septum site-determining protein MinC [Lysobacterales bacterium]